MFTINQKLRQDARQLEADLEECQDQLTDEQIERRLNQLDLIYDEIRKNQNCYINSQ